MQMRRSPRYVEVRPMQDTLFLLATGALAGVAAGAWLGRRYGSLGAFVDDMRFRLRDAREFWSAEDEMEGRDDEEELEAYRGAHDLPDEDDEGHFVESAAVDPGDTLPEPQEAHADDLPSNRPDERTLEARVLDRFEEDELLRQRAVDIAAVGEGVVELSGWVHSGDEAARAAALARAVQGVSMVLNRIVIRGPGAPGGPELTRDVPMPGHEARP
jgi:hypothetical protein